MKTEAAKKVRKAAPRPRPEDVYERLAPAYEILASESRIVKEVDAIERHLRSMAAARLLDAGCGAGYHTIELARRGFEALGIDRSESMIETARGRADRMARARAEAGETPLRVGFERFDLADSHRLPGAPFDAVVCLGNTMASVQGAGARLRALRAFRRALRPGGLLIVQMRDLVAIGARGFVFPVRSLARNGEEWILLRRQEPREGRVRFLSILLHRSAREAPWEMHDSETLQEPIPRAAWREALQEAGFIRVRAAYDLAGASRRPAAGASDIVLFARR